MVLRRLVILGGRCWRHLGSNFGRKLTLGLWIRGCPKFCETSFGLGGSVTSSAKHRQNTNPRRSFEIRHDLDLLLAPILVRRLLSPVEAIRGLLVVSV